jgi:DNA-binding CsgD family transcriptional regulator
VRLANAAAQVILAEAMQALAVASGPYTGRSIPLAGRGRAPMVVHLLPLRREARDIFSGAFCLLFVTSVVARKAPQPTLLEVLFDLTPAEAKVASLIANGRPVAAIAQRQGVAENTVRIHLKSIFAKTGVHRQAELVNLLSFPMALFGA